MKTQEIRLYVALILLSSLISALWWDWWQRGAYEPLFYYLANVWNVLWRVG